MTESCINSTDTLLLTVTEQDHIIILFGKSSVSPVHTKTEGQHFKMYILDILLSDISIFG